jgi:hypothetical protein
LQPAEANPFYYGGHCPQKNDSEPTILLSIVARLPCSLRS